MSDSKLARRGKKAIGLLAGVALVGGTLAAVAASASAVVVKTPVDLAGTTSATEVSPINRDDTLHTFSTISNVGTSGSARGSLLITVAGTTTASLSAPAGLTCGAQVPKLTGFTISCTTDAALAPSSSLTAELSISPSDDPKLTTIGVTSTVKIINTVPSTLMDPDTTNNHQKSVTRVGDIADIDGWVSGGSTVLRSEHALATIHLQNNGTNPSYAKFHLVVQNGLEFSFTPSADFTCTAMLLNYYGTGFSRTCTTVAPLASGASLTVPLSMTPSQAEKITVLKATLTSSKVGAMVVDPNLANNQSILPITIQAGIEV